MNPLMEEIFTTIVPSAPYLIAAYVLLLVAGFVYLFAAVRRVAKAEKRLDLIEESLEDSKK